MEEVTQRRFHPWAKFWLLLAGFCVAVFGFWKLYRNAYHSPFTIYKCDYSGFEDAYKLEFGFFEGGVQWRGWFTDEQRSASGQWKIGDDGFYHVRVSLLRTRLPENDGNNPAFRAVDAIFKKQTPADDRAKEKRYKRWVDVLDYDPDLNRFRLIKRIQPPGKDKEEYFPGLSRDKKKKSGERAKLYDKEAFDKELVDPLEIHFVPFDPESTY